MMSSDSRQLPRDPGSVPVSLRDAFARQRDGERPSAWSARELDTALDAVANHDADDDTRLAGIEQLLGSQQGAAALAHLVAARTATSGVTEFTGADGRKSVLRNVVTPLAPRRQRSAISMLKPVLLAASLMLVASTSWYVFTLPQSSDEVRSGIADVVLHPVARATPALPITLRWNALRVDARYSVEVLDVTDAPVFATETSATSAVVPGSTLRPGAYRWYVRSRALDGTEIRSRVEKFTVR